MPRATKPPTARSIARMITRLQSAMAIVYAEEGLHLAERTNEHGTMRVEWRSGAMVREERG